MTMRSIISVVILFATFSSSMVYANDQPPKTLDELKATVEKIREETHTPAVGIALVDKDGPVWVAGLGEANLEHQIRANENTLFPLGSVSKMFVSLAVLQLVEQGKLNLDDKLHDLAPEIQYKNKWEKTNPILLVHLLEHTTGWDDSHLDEFAYEAPPTLSLKDGLARFPASRKSRWVPGTRMAYCNTGPVVAAYIVEKVTGMKLEDYVQKNLFDPIGMTSSTYSLTGEYKKRGVTLYRQNGNIAPDRQTYLSPSGAVISSPTDMAKLLQLFLQRGSVNGKSIVSSASIDRMEIPKSTLGAAQGVTAGCGLANCSDGYGDMEVTFHGHGGDQPGAHTEVIYSPQLGSGFVLMVNKDGPAFGMLANVLHAYLLRDYHKQTVNAQPLPEQFKMVNGYYVQINPRNEELKLPNDFVFGIMHFSASNNRFHMRPLPGGWVSSDYAISDKLLVNPWEGLPAIAFANDPLAGKVIVSDSGVYKPISAFRVYGQLALVILLIAFSIGNLLFALVWIPRRLWGRLSGGASIQVRSWPVLASIVLAIGCFSPVIFGIQDMDALGTICAASIAIFIASLLYPALALYSLFVIFKARSIPMNRWLYWNATVLTAIHIVVVIYLATYGWIGLRSWA